MKKTIFTLALLTLLGGSGYAYYRYRSQKPAPAVTTSAVARGDIVDRVGATGTSQAVTTVQVGTQVSGTIQALYADFNSLVHKGQVLARLDPSLFQTQIEQARANLLRAQADVERLRVALEDARTKAARARELYGRQLLPRSDLDAAEVAVRSAEAQVRSADAQVVQAQASLNQNQVNLQHTVIEAPIDGLVISRNVDVGQTVAASMQAPTLFVLAADLTKMQVIANLDESDVGRIRPGQHVSFRVDAYPAEDFTGTVAQVRLQPIVQQNVVTYATVIDVPNPELKLKPGMTANVSIEIARRTNVLRVPNTALRFRPTNDIYAALGQTPAPIGRGGVRAADGGAAPATAVASGGASSGGTGSASGPAAPAEREPRSPSGRQTADAPQAAGAGTRTGDGAAERTGDAEPAARGGGRERFMERLQQMSPEERERALERMRSRGFTPGETAPEGRASSQEVASGAGRRGGTNGTEGRARDSASAAAKTAKAGKKEPTTIDALFGPLPAIESTGRVWIFADKQLKPLRLRLGVTDGQATELLEGEGIDEGTELVTSVSTGTEATRPAAATGGAFPPFMGQQPGRSGGPGGFGGGGGGNRGGGR